MGNPELVQLLISASVQLLGDEEVRLMTKDVDVDHNTPLMLAVEGGCASITQLLIGCMKIHPRMFKKGKFRLMVRKDEFIND